MNTATPLKASWMAGIGSSTTSKATSATNRNSKGPRTDDGNRSPPPDTWEAGPFHGHEAPANHPQPCVGVPGMSGCQLLPPLAFRPFGSFRSGWLEHEYPQNSWNVLSRRRAIAPAHASEVG